MNVGWVGLGKLGLPCALVLSDAGHDVYGYDPSDEPARVLDGQPMRTGDDVSGLLPTRMVLADSVASVVDRSEVVFVAVPTPHSPAYGGEVPAPAQRRDFDYGALVDACAAVCDAANELHREITLVVVSTVLPGTCDRLIVPLLGRYVRLVYNPFFIAMGTTVRDFRSPEFVLLGVHNRADAEPVAKVYSLIHDRPLVTMAVPSAELTKVAYNTFISMKIVFANVLMEMCHGTNADVDQVTSALALATDRVISPKYLQAGMGDGGACHPRDLIAMSWLSNELGMSTDLLGFLSQAREDQSQWLANLVGGYSTRLNLPVVVLGKAYKPGSPLTDGSPALLLAHQLRDCYQWDPHVDGEVQSWRPAVYVIATAHEEFFTLNFPAGSVVVDPWGRTPNRFGVKVVRPGRR